MTTDLHVTFPGNCNTAFAFYETVFGSKRRISMTYGDAPQGVPVPEAAKDLVMHTAMPLGGMTLMGCDAHPDQKGAPMGGFRISVCVGEEAEVRRLFAALSEDGGVQMALAATFWTPLFGMCTDKFGVEWMVSVPGPQPA